MTRIRDIKVLEIFTTLNYDGDFWEERLIRPIDIYPEHDVEGPSVMAEGATLQINKSTYKTRGIFVQIETDEGLSSVFGPIGAPDGSVEAFIILRRLRNILIGCDVLEREKIWDKMYRLMVHDRKGTGMIAISAIDCCLWDLFGKITNMPVYRLIGGPTREKLQAYASMLGFSVKPKDVEKVSREYYNMGFKCQKWFMRFGPQHGVKGFEDNIKVVKTIRDALGNEVEIMVDAWMSWSVEYAFKIMCTLDRYDVLWVEEPLMPDNLEGYIKLRRLKDSAGLHIKLAGGEHEYTRWGFKTLIDNKIFDILQPDIAWAGGLTECLKICAMASANDVQVIPHTAVMPVTLHLAFGVPMTLTPLAEYLVKWNVVNQAFFKTRYEPKLGFFEPPKLPGLGLELREDPGVEKKELSLFTVK
jgi:L-alanine-DL-glutamate epimerase-like enolase superfamily enzyme